MGKSRIKRQSIKSKHKIKVVSSFWLNIRVRDNRAWRETYMRAILGLFRAM